MNTKEKKLLRCIRRAGKMVRRADLSADGIFKKGEDTANLVTVYDKAVQDYLEVFEVLVNCNLYKADVDAILTGVAEDDTSSEMYANARATLAIYNAAYSVYNAKISGVNVNVSAILQLVVTLRDPAQIDNVVATMLTLAD